MSHYRDFTFAPQWAHDGSSDPRDSDSWIAWMIEDHVTHDFRAFPDDTCEFCGGPVDGYHLCYQCKLATPYVDHLIASSYSLDSGLEPLVRAYKDYGRAWAASPLASLVIDVIERHADCINAYLGPNAIHTWVPADSQKRGFDHLENLISSSPSVEEFGWIPRVLERDRAHDRPRPGRAGHYINPDAYRVTQDVRGANVLLFDDLWTSGASMASSAASLRAAGAGRIVGLVLGRQLRRGNKQGRAPVVFGDVEARGWAFDDCGIHRGCGITTLASS